MKLINIGFGNLVAAGRIVAVVSPEAAPTRRLTQEARERGLLIDASSGRRTRAVIVVDSGHVILSFMDSDKLLAAVNDHRTQHEEESVL